MNNRMLKIATFSIGACLVACINTGCSSIQHVQPWEKNILSRPEMTFETDILDTKYTEHILFSKESASGGSGVGGGGCGCN